VFPPAQGVFMGLSDAGFHLRGLMHCACQRSVLSETRQLIEFRRTSALEGGDLLRECLDFDTSPDKCRVSLSLLVKGYSSV
jgi:hypothetical protein